MIVFLSEKSSSSTKSSFTKSLEIFCRGRTVRMTLIITDGISFTREQCFIILQSSNEMWTLLGENYVKSVEVFNEPSTSWQRPASSFRTDTQAVKIGVISDMKTKTSKEKVTGRHLMLSSIWEAQSPWKNTCDHLTITIWM